MAVAYYCVVSRANTQQHHRPGEGRPSPYVVQAVVKTSALLEAFEDSDTLNLVELSERTGLPKPSVFRLAASLESVGLLEKTHDGRYALGLRLVSLARVVLSRSLGSAALPFLEELHQSFGHSVSLATLSNGEMIFLETLESRRSFRVVSTVGAREAVHRTAVGKAVAAHLHPADIDRIFTEHPLRPATPRTITSRSRFEAELEEVRVRGYSTDVGECYIGCNGVGAPVFDRRGVVGGISVSAPADQMPEDDFPLIGRALVDTTNRLSLSLGAHSSTLPNLAV